MKSIMTSISATPQKEIGGFGVDTGTCFVGVAGELVTIERRQMCSWEPHGHDELDGILASTGVGDGYYGVYEGPGYTLCPEAVAFVEFIPPVVRHTHTDIDGDVSFDEDEYPRESVKVGREATFDVPKGVISFVGDPSGGSVDIHDVQVPPGRYTVKLLVADLGGMWGTRNVAIAVVPAT